MKRLTSIDQQFLHSLPTAVLNIPEKYVLTMVVRLPGALLVQLSMVLAVQFVTRLGETNSDAEAEERCSVVCVPDLLEMQMDVSQTRNLTDLQTCHGRHLLSSEDCQYEVPHAMDSEYDVSYPMDGEYDGESPNLQEDQKEKNKKIE